MERRLSLARGGAQLQACRDRRRGAARDARNAVPERVSPQRACRQMVRPLVRRRRHGHRRALRRGGRSFPQPIRRHARLPRRDQGWPHPKSRLRQDAAGRYARKRFPPAGERVQHLGRHRKRPAAVAMGRRAALRARSGDARDARRGGFRRRAEGFLGASQDRSLQRRAVQFRHRLRVQDDPHALSHPGGRRDPPAAGHAALSLMNHDLH